MEKNWFDWKNWDRTEDRDITIYYQVKMKIFSHESGLAAFSNERFARARVDLNKQEVELYRHENDDAPTTKLCIVAELRPA